MGSNSFCNMYAYLAGKEIEKETVEAEFHESPRKLAESRLNPLPLLDISNTSSSQSSPQLSPTKIEEGWLVAPPPCFTLNCTSSLEISPLEDLLIEHPSMSVYGRIPNLKFYDPELEKKKRLASKAKMQVESNRECLSDITDSVIKSSTKSDPPKSHYDIAGTKFYLFININVAVFRKKEKKS